MLDTNKSLIENSDYLKRLSLELKKKDLKEIDSNLLYEVAYANTYLDVLLSKSNNASLSTELLDIKSVFDTILASASYEEVSKLKGSFDYKKLLRCKYDDVDKASYERRDGDHGSRFQDGHKDGCMADTVRKQHSRICCCRFCR